MSTGDVRCCTKLIWLDLQLFHEVIGDFGALLNRVAIIKNDFELNIVSKTLDSVTVYTCLSNHVQPSLLFDRPNCPQSKIYHTGPTQRHQRCHVKSDHQAISTHVTRMNKRSQHHRQGGSRGEVDKGPTKGGSKGIGIRHGRHLERRFLRT